MRIYFSQTSVIYFAGNLAAVNIIGMSVIARSPQGEELTVYKFSFSMHNVPGRCFPADMYRAFPTKVYVR